MKLRHLEKQELYTDVSAGSQHPQPKGELQLCLFQGGLGWGTTPRGAVFMQQGHAAEGPRARAALVLLHLWVGLQVGSQVGAVGEGPVAVLTSKGALTFMGNRGTENTVSTRATFCTHYSYITVSVFKWSAAEKNTPAELMLLFLMQTNWWAEIRLCPAEQLHLLIGQ